jgi:hypothetical protein
MDWTTFYLGTAGAAATLIGLLFVGVQFRLSTLRDDPASRWRLIARSTCTMYVSLFVLPMLFLIPTLNDQVRGVAILAVVLFCSLRTVRTWLPVWRATQRRGERWTETAWLLVGPLAAYLALAYFGARLYLQGDPDAVQTSIALVLIAFFSIVLRNSWSLLVEVQDRAPAGAAPAHSAPRGLAKRG